MSWTWEDRQYFHAFGIEVQDDPPVLPPEPVWEGWELRLLEDHEATKQSLAPTHMPWWKRWFLVLCVGSPIAYFLLWGALEGWKHVGH